MGYCRNVAILSATNELDSKLAKKEQSSFFPIEKQACTHRLENDNYRGSQVIKYIDCI